MFKNFFAFAADRAAFESGARTRRSVKVLSALWAAAVQFYVMFGSELRLGLRLEKKASCITATHSFLVIISPYICFVIFLS